MVYKLFSERNKPQTEDMDIYTYDNICKPFRVKLFFLIEDIIDRLNNIYRFSDINIWPLIHDGYCREKGIKVMDNSYGTPISSKIEKYVDKASDEDLLDFIDFAFNYLIYLAIKAKRNDPLCRADKEIKNAISELNERFQQHRLGYELSNGELIRIDNKHIHREQIKPALNLLHANGFEGAEDEYTKAFEALRNKDNKKAIIEAEKAFESTMKTICLKKGYTFDPERDSASKLIGRLKDNHFFPSYTERQLNAVVETLESGAPTIRNKTSGHGQGEVVVEIHDSYAKYVIGLVAVNIVLLVQLFTEK